MAFPIENVIAPVVSDSSSPLSKRRRFAPNNLPAIIQCIDNSSIEHHTFNSPLLAQLCEQAPTPEEIEASLLQVGMRVRKSVNEGYKNSQKKFTPRPFSNNLHRLSPETQKALLAGNSAQSSELSPYYAGGLHNVGGMAIQPLATATFCGINLAALAYRSDDWSSPSVAEQQLWSYSTSHKRGYEADSDSDDSQEWLPQTPTLAADTGFAMPLDYFNIDVDNQSDVSPMTQIDDPFRSGLHGRRVAKPKSRMRHTQMVEAPMPPTTVFNPFSNITTMHQQEPQFGGYTPSSGHRRMLSCGVEANMVNDFGDASFLQRREDVEMDCS